MYQVSCFYHKVHDFFTYLPHYNNPYWISGSEENGHRYYLTINLHKSTGPCGAQTRDPWICSQTNYQPSRPVHTHTHLLWYFPISPWIKCCSVLTKYAFFLKLSIIICGSIFFLNLDKGYMLWNIIIFVLFVWLILYVPSTIFQLKGTGLPGLNQY